MLQPPHHSGFDVRVSHPQVPVSTPGGSTLLGTSQAMHELRRQIQQMAPVPHSVLIAGETGTGKELIAQELHRQGPRARQPLVTLNCAAIPETLAESELFGHEKGSFTHAHRQHRGAFERAGEGTLFLDEVGELPLALQAKLLRVLETGQFQGVGAEKMQTTRARVVAASHRDLRQMIQSGQFREDLYHRLSILQLQVPPLRARREDIAELIEHFRRGASQELQKPIHISSAALALATQQAWHGNVRALRNAVYRAAILHTGVIGPAELLADCHEASFVSTAREEARETIHVPRGDYATMKRALLEAVIAREGSIRKAAVALRVPRSTLGGWLKSSSVPKNRDLTPQGATSEFFSEPGGYPATRPEGRDYDRVGSF